MKWDSKEEVRRLVYRRLREAGVARPPFPIEGRIPNFAGAEEAARRLTSTREWLGARVVKVNPDSPQRPVRLAALVQGKVLVMPTPRIRRGFLLLDPSRIPRRAFPRAATIRGAFRYGRLLSSLGEVEAHLPRIDLIVEGSVAVSVYGDRIGKGEGYGDLEYGILRELGIVGEGTPIFTSVHDLQVFEERLPQAPHDVPVDAIFTPGRAVRVEGRRPRPPGILWDSLSSEKLQEIPLLRELARRVGRS